MGDSNSKIKNWPKVRSEAGPSLLLFDVRYDFVQNPRTQQVLKRVILETRDWVNVVAITPDHKIVLVKQFRFGSGHITTEIPAGLIDPGENSLDSARRELKEETGYTTEDWRYLGRVQPNPAFLDNYCHHWLAVDVKKKFEPTLDAGEDIEVNLYTFDQMRSAINKGEVDHVLALSALSRISSFWQDLEWPLQKKV
jgi:8-oxo-dGTP pyrophosphatase MutT (NUDIX family)